MLTWDMNHRSFCRQFPEWLAFLPIGTRPTWTSYNEDQTRGILITRPGPNDEQGAPTEVPNEIDTNKTRAALEDFLVCLGTYCPENFMHTVLKESTSYDWVLKRIQETFNLDTKGVRFLAGCKVKAEAGDEAQTHQQKFQALDKDEVLTPFGKNVIVEKWLDDTHPDLKDHIVQTRGSLFTEQRPNLSDNQKQLCDQMDTLLQEIDQKKSNPTVNRTGFAPIRRQTQYQPATRPNYGRPPPRQMPRQVEVPAGAGQPGRAPCPPNRCFRCHEAGRQGPASHNHFASECSHPRTIEAMLTKSTDFGPEDFPTS